MERKYDLLEDDTLTLADGTILHRIKALRDFGNVEKGDLGGYIEKEENLSHDEDCWVSGYAKVYDNAQVFDNAKVYDNAQVSGDAWIYDNAQVYGNAQVHDNAQVFDNAWVCFSAQIFDNAKIRGDVAILGRAKVCNCATVDGNAVVSDNATINGTAHITDRSVACGNAIVAGKLCSNAMVSGDVLVVSEAVLSDDANVKYNNNYVALNPPCFIELGYFPHDTVFLTIDGEVSIYHENNTYKLTEFEAYMDIYYYRFKDLYFEYLTPAICSVTNSIIKPINTILNEHEIDGEDNNMKSTKNNDTNKKYELVTEYKKIVDGIEVCRIRALRDFADVMTGDLGGYVMSENNLSHDGICWIYDNATVGGSGAIHDDAVVEGDARVFNSNVYNNAIIGGKALVQYCVAITDNAHICENSRVSSSIIGGNALIRGDACIEDAVKIFGNVTVCDKVSLKGDMSINGDTKLSGTTTIVL